MHKLFGDGIHDDTLAIQEMLDSRISEVVLPPTKSHYCISATLRIHSNQTLRLGETTKIKLLPNSDCYMLTNAEKDAHDICVVGGIWDYDNVNQRRNPGRLAPGKADPTFKMHTHGAPGPWKQVSYERLGYMGVIVSFDHVTRLTLRDMTMKDPVTYCIRMAYVEYFTVENIRFDMNLGNPSAENMDGVHIDGGCRFGSIRNVQGTCYDDIVALNADDGYDGPISDIQVDGVFGKDSLRGVRLLSVQSPVTRISISNVFGTYYQNCVSLSFHYPKCEYRGEFGHITLRNLHGCDAPRIPEYGKEPGYMFSYIWVDGSVKVDSLIIDNVERVEELADAETIRIERGAQIRRMSVSNVEHQSKLDVALPLMRNKGNIEKLYLYNLDAGKDAVLINEGTIEKIIEN